MNNQRRKQISEALLKFQALDLQGKLEDIKSLFQSSLDDEQDYHDNMPEGLQNGDKGQKAEASISALEELICALEEIVEKAEEIEGLCETASE